MRVLGAAVLAQVASGHGSADAGVASGWHKPPTPLQVTAGDHDYEVAGETYQGYLAMPPEGMKVAGALLVAHQWMGLLDYEKARAEQAASMGYIAFALDIYGKGQRCSDVNCAVKLSSKASSDVPKLRELISSGTRELVAANEGRTDNLVAMGYCFGGTNVLELARHPNVGASNGVTYKAVSGIHSGLTPWAEATSQGEVQTWVQIHHAELDFSGDDGLAGFEKEIRVGVNGSEAIWETIKYAKCEHGWTEPGTPQYNARAAVQSHKSTFEFFQMALGNEDPEADAFPADPFCTKAASSALV